MLQNKTAPDAHSMIGAYGAWAAGLVAGEPGAFSWRNPRWTDLDEWRSAAHGRLLERLALPSLSGPPSVTVQRTFTYEGLHIEDLSWQLPYGLPTQAYLLKPAGTTGRLPAILGLHCHSGLKFFGREKLTRTGETLHPLIERIHARDGGVAWANEIARRGYVVLVHDAFAFGSRRVRLADVPPVVRGERSDPEWDDVAGIEAYNRWAAEHESIMAKSLFCAGTTWPGVFLAEDRAALDVLCSRVDVDATRIGCGGLSGGGLRTVMLAGADERIACAVCVGMMTTWRDFLLNKSHTHTWMIYAPLLPNELDYPEILGLRVPKPTLVLNDIDDPLFTLPEMERADAMLKAVYDKAGAADRYRCSFYPGGHKFDLPMQAEAFEWFDRWLKG
jgi:dienelactone hydrolase